MFCLDAKVQDWFICVAMASQHDHPEDYGVPPLKKRCSDDSAAPDHDEVELVSIMLVDCFDREGDERLRCKSLGIALDERQSLIEKLIRGDGNFFFSCCEHPNDW